MQDHPRRCGENHVGVASMPPRRGSPPQVRGKPRTPCCCRLDDGITPAGAGKTGSRSAAPQAARDHPRRCGENYIIIALICQYLGSPPQVRGKLKARSPTCCKSGITPAGAGKTIKKKSQFSQHWDHPRRCGENFHVFTSIFQPPGSPPQVRGKQASQVCPR